MSAMAAIGIPQLATGPQKWVLKNQVGRIKYKQFNENSTDVKNIHTEPYNLNLY